MMKNNVYILVILIIYINAISASRATKNFKKQFNENYINKKGSDEEYLFSKSKPKNDLHEKISVKVDDSKLKNPELQRDEIPVYEYKKSNIRSVVNEQESTETDEDLTNPDSVTTTTASGTNQGDESKPTEEDGEGDDFTDKEKTEEEVTDEETPTPIPDIPLIPLRPNIFYVINEDTLRNCLNQENATQCVLLNDIEIINNDNSQWIVNPIFEGSINGRNNRVIFKDKLSKSGFINKLNYTEIKDITFVFISEGKYEFSENEITDEYDNKYSGMLFNQVINSRLSNVEIIFNQTITTEFSINNDINFGIVSGSAISTEFNRVTIDFISPLEITNKDGNIRRNMNELEEDIFTSLLIGNGKKINIINSYVRVKQFKITERKNFGLMVGQCDDCNIEKSYTQAEGFEISKTKSGQHIYSGIIADSVDTLIHNSFTIITGLKLLEKDVLFGGIIGKASRLSKITLSYIDIRLNTNVHNVYGFIANNTDDTIEMSNCRGFIKGNNNMISSNYINGNNKKMNIMKLLIDLKNPEECIESKISINNKYSDVYIYECEKINIKGIKSVSSRNISSSTFPGLDFTSNGYFKIFGKDGNIIYNNNNNELKNRILQDESEDNLFVGLSRLPNTDPFKEEIYFTKIAASKYEVDGDCWDSNVWTVSEKGELIISREPERRVFEIPITGLYPILKDNNRNSRCENNCNNHGICRRNECICINNWTGKNCDLRKCSYGNYHFNNTYNIVMECSGIGKCNRNKGVCECPKTIIESGNEIEVSYVNADSNTTNCEYIYSNI